MIEPIAPTQQVFSTDAGTRYLKDPICALMAQTRMEPAEEMLGPLSGIDASFHTGMEDFYASVESWSEHPDNDDRASSGELLIQLAGQFCYLALGEKRTPVAENAKYIRELLKSGHGSVLEHVNYTVLFLGIDRATTHELVRHRAGCAYSQVSQRYVGPEKLRFVMPWEDRLHPKLTENFYKDIDLNRAQYARRIEDLKEVMPQGDNETNTEWRKRIQSSARSVLGNYTEAGIIFTGNTRAWRHVFNMRTSKFADVRIRRPFTQALAILQKAAPHSFADFELTPMSDGTYGSTPMWPKP